MNRNVHNFLILVLVIGSAKYGLAQKYQANWSSLGSRETPTWWTDAKFGIFIHWGPYSVPAYAPVDEVEGVYAKYAEHYENRLRLGNKLFTAYHQKTYGDRFAYSDFAPMFTAEHFDPTKWAELFKRSGAKYVVLTSKHHDGFCLWPSKYSPKWNSAEIGSNRDLSGELTQAVRDAGLHMGFYYSLLEWSHPMYKKETVEQWVNNHMIPQMIELVDNYQPDILFADGEWDYRSDTLKSAEFLAWLYNESTVKDKVVVNDRWGKETRGKHGDYYTTEYDLVHNKKGIGDKAFHPWEESRGIGTSYGYNQFETPDHYSSAKQLIDLLIDKVSNGGNLLLNVGPTANGLIPAIMQDRLLEMGNWLRVNGDAIYGTTAWGSKPLELSLDGVYFTQKNTDLYAIFTRWPDQELVLPIDKKAAAISLLGSAVKIEYTYRSGKVFVQPPAINPGNMPCDHAWVFKIEGALNSK